MQDGKFRETGISAMNLKWKSLLVEIFSFLGIYRACIGNCIRTFMEGGKIIMNG